MGRPGASSVHVRYQITKSFIHPPFPLAFASYAPPCRCCSYSAFSTSFFSCVASFVKLRRVLLEATVTTAAWNMGQMKQTPQSLPTTK